MMRLHPYGANYLNWDDMVELKEAIDRKILFRYQTQDASISDRLESHVCNKFGCRHALTTHSCTQGLRLALLATRPAIGDKVYIPAVSFVAVADAVLSCGLIPVLSEVDDDFGLDFGKLPAGAERVISVPLDGKIGQYPPSTIPYLIEDVAQSLGATYPNNKYVGTVGFAGVYSFHHNKILTSGVGGLVVMNDYESFKRMRSYHDHGSTRKQGEYLRWNDNSGYGEDLISSELVSAVQLQQFRHLDELKKKLSDEYDRYKSEFESIRNCRIISRSDGDVKVTLRLKLDSPELAQKAIKEIQAKGLPLWSLERYFLPDHATLLHKNSIYRDGFPWNLVTQDLWDRGRFANTKGMLRRILCLPISAHLDAKTRDSEITSYKRIIRDL